MAWCLMAPSHYLNQCWLIIKDVLWHSPGSNLRLRRTADEHNPQHLFWHYIFKHYYHIYLGSMSCNFHYSKVSKKIVIFIVVQLWSQKYQLEILILFSTSSPADTHLKRTHTNINPLPAKLFRGNINIYSHFMSLLHIDMTQVLIILPQVRPGLTYSTQLISWLLMSLWRKEPGHQQPWYWPS